MANPAHFNEVTPASFLQAHQDPLSRSTLMSMQPPGAMALASLDTLTSSAVGLSPFTNTEVTRHPPNKHFSSWYTHEISPTCMHPAKEAFEKAVKVFSQDVLPNEEHKRWLSEKTSMADVQKALQDAETNYKDSLSKSKVRTILMSCSSRVTYYAPILDTLAQHYPEYTSLVWGAFKFFFTVMINFEELLVEFSRAITTIANVLPRTELLYELYPTEEMQSAVANTYAKIIQFVLEVAKWYKKNKLQHAIAAIVKPFKLSFKGIVDEIAERSRLVDELAAAASKAELRDVHLKVNTLYHENTHLRNDTSLVRRELLELRQQFQFMTQTMIESRTLQNQMMLNQQGQTMMMLEWQVENIRHLLESSESTYSSAEAMLSFCQSMRNRRRQRTPTLIPRHDLALLREWVDDQKSSLLLAQAQGIRNSSIDFAVDFLEAVTRSNAPIAWALPSSFDTEPTIIGILQSLVLQIMNAKGGTDLDMVTVRDIRDATTVERWFAILERCLRRLVKVFVVIDMGLIQRVVDGEMVDSESWDAPRFLDRLQRVTKARSNGWVKVLVVSWMNGKFGGPLVDSFTDLTLMYTDRGIIQERRQWGPKNRSVMRRNVSMSLRQLQQAVDGPDKVPR
jgi:hypothetical protein